MQMKTEQIRELEKEAEQNNGHCSRCSQTIKIYRYKINKVHATFLKAMAKKVSESGHNDVDISEIGLSYSTRSQVTKMRQHGLIARVKNDSGKQTASHWLITNKGWDFLKGKPIPQIVVVYNNQVLGHDGGLITFNEALGVFSPAEQDGEAITEAEARTYENIRTPRNTFTKIATFIGKDFSDYKNGVEYELEIEKLQMGKPVSVIYPTKIVYSDISKFQKDWRIVE